MVISFELAKAREAVRRAKNALRTAERHYDEDQSFGDGNLSLITQIRAAERQVAEARAKLRQIDPDSTE